MMPDPMMGDPKARAFVQAKVEWARRYKAGQWHQGDGTPADVVRTYKAFSNEYGSESQLDVSMRIRRMLRIAWEREGWDDWQ